MGLRVYQMISDDYDPRFSITVNCFVTRFIVLRGQTTAMCRII